MRRRTVLAALIGGCLLSATAIGAGAAPLTLEQRVATLRYIAGFQNPDGGFASTAGGPSGLGSTNASLRTFRYLGNKAPALDLVERFVRSCYKPEAGAYSDRPDAEPSVRATAMGVMCMAELQKGFGDEEDKIRAYLGANAKEQGDIYIAAAALYAAALKMPKGVNWSETYQQLRREDGSYGPTIADTSRAVVSLLRLGKSPRDRKQTLALMQAAQRSDGGFGDPQSDLASIYPTMRAFWMMKEAPDLQRLGEFIDACRNEDGGYGNTADAPSTVSHTYYAAISMHFARDLEDRNLRYQEKKDGLRAATIRKGEGARAKKDSKVTVHYTGWLETSGEVFDSSRTRNQPFTFTLGKGEVIKGWDEGVDGMRVGELRRLVIPAELGYGERGTPGGPIPPNSVLVFDVELLAVE